jgi:DNA-binding transcriptional LysR family regulator
MDRVDEMKAFVRVVEGGSFTAAARSMGLRQPTISKAVQSLENRLGVRLLHRSSTAMSTTEAGQRYYEQAQRLLELLDDMECTVRQRTEEAEQGTIRLSAPASFGRLKLAAPLFAFMERHPAIQVDLLLSDGDADLISLGLDLAVRVGRLPDSPLVGRRIAASPRITVAAPSYLARKGSPLSPKDLNAHDCVVYTRLRRGRCWRYEGPDGPIDVDVDGRFRTDSSETTRQAVLAGLGIGYVPMWLVSEPLRDGRLLPLLSDYRAESALIQVVLPQRNFVTRRTRLLVDFLVEVFKADPDVNDAIKCHRDGNGGSLD